MCAVFRPLFSDPGHLPGQADPPMMAIRYCVPGIHLPNNIREAHKRVDLLDLQYKAAKYYENQGDDNPNDGKRLNA